MRDKRPSATAGLILESIAFLSFDPQLKHFISEDNSKISKNFLKSSLFSKGELLKTFEKEWFRKFISAMERFLVPGIMLHYILRKRYIEEAVIRTLEKENINQVVILAAGFDSLSYRLSAEFPQVNFIEVDHPATQQSKKQVLDEVGLEASNLSFLAVDFSKENLEGKLSAIKQPGQAGILFIAEGITMYLDETQIKQLFDFVSKSTTLPRQFIFTFMERQPDGTIDFKYTNPLVNFWLNLKKEKFKWGLSQKEFPDFLNDNNFHLRELATHSTLRLRYLLPPLNTLPLAEGECICIAEPMNN